MEKFNKIEIIWKEYPKCETDIKINANFLLNEDNFNLEENFFVQRKLSNNLSKLDNKDSISILNSIVELLKNNSSIKINRIIYGRYKQ